MNGDAEASGANAETLNSEGRKLRDDGRYEDAIALFSRAIAVDAAYYDAYVNRAEAYERTGQFARAAADLARAAKLHEGRPWHQTWWAAAIWIWIPLVFWYGLYVFFAKLRWKERGAVAGIVVGLLATLFVGGVAVTVYRGSSDSRLASNDYEKQVVVLIATSRDIADKASRKATDLRNDPSLAGQSYIAANRPVLQEYRASVMDLRSRWAALQPPSEAMEFHAKGTEYWDFEIATTDEELSAKTEQELATVYTERVDGETKLNKEFYSLYQDLLNH